MVNFDYLTDIRTIRCDLRSFDCRLLLYDSKKKIYIKEKDIIKDKRYCNILIDTPIYSPCIENMHTITEMDKYFSDGNPYATVLFRISEIRSESDFHLGPEFIIDTDKFMISDYIHKSMEKLKCSRIPFIYIFIIIDEEDNIANCMLLNADEFNFKSEIKVNSIISNSNVCKAYIYRNMKKKLEEQSKDDYKLYPFIAQVKSITDVNKDKIIYLNHTYYQNMDLRHLIQKELLEVIKSGDIEINIPYPTTDGSIKIPILDLAADCGMKGYMNELFIVFGLPKAYDTKYFRQNNILEYIQIAYRYDDSLNTIVINCSLYDKDENIIEVENESKCQSFIFQRKTIVECYDIVEEKSDNKDQTKNKVEDGNTHISWEEYFYNLALLSAKRSKDPVCKVGAVIVNDKNRIVSVGYNGMPNGCPDIEMPWYKDEDPINNKLYYVVHAELNAILNTDTNLSGCTLYVTHYPCNECMKAIIQSGIKQVFYGEYDPKHGKINIITKLLATKAGVKLNKIPDDMVIHVQ